MYQNVSTVTIPYIKEWSERSKRIGNHFTIRMIFKPKNDNEN